MKSMQLFFSKASPSLCLLLLLPIFILLLTFFAVYPDDVRPTCDGSDASFVGPVNVVPDFRLLIGVFTTAWTFERRHLIWLAYSKSQWPNDDVAHRVNLPFVLCNVTDEEHATMAALEIMLHRPELRRELNDGKTYNYFSSLPGIFGRHRPYDYVMKTDDDTYLRLETLLESLKNKPRNDVYYGLEIPCNSTEFPFWISTPFMTGLGYVLSWDLMEWIAESDVPVNYTKGPEDMILGWWLKMGEKGKIRYNNAPMIYDFRGADQDANCFRHNLTADTIAVHRLKDNSRWATVLEYFSSMSLQPSKLHHIP